ncbi:MAG TPA: phenylalanine--tRNA ligase subunit alpha [Elusimicrobiota bacterium]|nr:phenylalanine--tRNA ligase subunit alpha [Elusimicrobiota bacterium]
MPETDRKQWESQLEAVRAAFAATAAQTAADLKALDDIRVRFLGRKGGLTELLKLLKDFPIAEKRELGPKAQETKESFEAVIARRQMELEENLLQSKLSGQRIDVSLPSYREPRGRLHPLTLVMDEMTRILTLMGFSLAQGPHVETEHHNFEALNIPKHHPARDMLDTFYLKGAPGVLRTHTSPVQIRVMEKQKPPLRIICPGRVFRHEEVDASHSSVFHQIEGLAVDKGVSFADLKGTLDFFLKELFGQKTQTRYRPSYFPFTEPSTEVDVRCLFCSGAGCPACKRSGWMEILGAGVVNPNVLKAVGLDPAQWSGFAFGVGVERVAMLRLGVNDMRLFYENDQRFLVQFDG